MHCVPHLPGPGRLEQKEPRKHPETARLHPSHVSQDSATEKHLPARKDKSQHMGHNVDVRNKNRESTFRKTASTGICSQTESTIHSPIYIQISILLIHLPTSQVIFNELNITVFCLLLLLFLIFPERRVNVFWWCRTLSYSSPRTNMSKLMNNSATLNCFYGNGLLATPVIC